MLLIRRLSVLSAIVALLSGCGGGGGGGDAVSPPGAPGGGGGSEVNTYGNTNLPGALVVVTDNKPTRRYDLRTGANTVVPGFYFPGTDRTWALRPTGVDANGASRFERVKVADWSAQGTVAIAGEFTAPKLSPNGNHILTFWREADSTAEARLAIFEAQSGQLVKLGSFNDGALLTSSPAAWLPSGNYLYLAGRNLYEGAIGQPKANDRLVAQLALPGNAEGAAFSGFSDLTVSPDGKRLAVNWRTPRASTTDSHVWVANTDGTDLHQVTAPLDPNSGSTYVFGGTTWSPDSQWLAFSYYGNGSIVVPAGQSYPDLGPMAAATGCPGSPVFVLPATAVKATPKWPLADETYGIKVRNPEFAGGSWLTSCNYLFWVP